MNQQTLNLKSSIIPSSQPNLDAWCKMYNIGSRCSKDNSFLLSGSIVNKQYNFENYFRPNINKLDFSIRGIISRILYTIFN